MLDNEYLIESELCRQAFINYCNDLQVTVKDNEKYYPIFTAGYVAKQFQGEQNVI